MTTFKCGADALACDVVERVRAFDAEDLRRLKLAVSGSAALLFELWGLLGRVGPLADVADFLCLLDEALEGVAS